jgi:hypothetical protein
MDVEWIDALHGKSSSWRRFILATLKTARTATSSFINERA